MTLEEFFKDAGPEEIEKLIQNSRTSERRRAILPLHSDNYAGPQVLLQAIQPESYMLPHNRKIDETIILLQGEISYLGFNENGILTFQKRMGPHRRMITSIPGEIYRSAVSHARDTVVALILQGPHNPEENYRTNVSWAPAEGSAEAPEYLKHLRGLCD